jgi:membrane fusion protein (multidrug efflux system)
VSAETSKVVEMRTAAEGAKPAQEAKQDSKRPRGGRLALIVSVPLLLAVVGGYFYLTGGRYVSTDNAYVQQNRITVYPEVSGTITRIGPAQNAYVKAGDLLFEINPEPFRIALEQADAAVAAARLQVAQLRSSYQSALAAQKTAEDNLNFRKSAFDRQQDLVKRGVSSQATFDQAQNDLHTAEQQLAQARNSVESARSALGGDPNIETDKHPAVMQAMAARDKAALDLQRTTVKAPSSGVVAQTDRLQIGQYITTSTAVLSLVETDNSWVEANFKETDLTHMSVGQHADIVLDAYPGKSFDATVESIGAGTGSQFSIIPAQNATGNWVKVVQRLPVRLKIAGAPELPFRTGLSANVEVDTGHNRLGAMLGYVDPNPPAGQFANGKRPNAGQLANAEK